VFQTWHALGFPVQLTLKTANNGSTTSTPYNLKELEIAQAVDSKIALEVHSKPASQRLS
jgi:hypothetical protein